MKPTEEKIQGNASDLPVYLFKQGNNCEAYRYFGAHLETRAGTAMAPHVLPADRFCEQWRNAHAGTG